MDAAWPKYMTVLLPVVGVTVLFWFMSSSSRKAEAKMNNVNFVLRESKASAIVGIISVFVGCAAWAAVLYLHSAAFWAVPRAKSLESFKSDSAVLVSILLCVVFIMGGAFLVYAYFRRRLIVTKDQVTYYYYFKKATTFKFKQLTKAREKQAGSGLKTLYVYSGDKVVFYADSTNPGYMLLLKRLRQEHVPFENQRTPKSGKRK